MCCRVFQFDPKAKNSRQTGWEYTGQHTAIVLMLKILKNKLCHSAVLFAILPRDLPICQAPNLSAGNTARKCMPP